ncbi:MAG TPA: hypothetical protein VGP44_00870 [Gemmatimonadales bacterium]|nr:hypothetical protein [Gemmatimonadales bacterium]
MRARLAFACPLVVGLIWATSRVNVAEAQSPALRSAQSPLASDPVVKGKRSKRAGQSSSAWRVAPALRVDAEYDNNVFLLAPLKKGDLAAPSTSELISGRYTDMKSAKDVLTTMSAGLSLKGPGLMGKTSQIAPELSYELYAQNPARSNVSLGLSLQQDLWADGRLRIEGRLTPSYFGRNYLANAVDQDADGSISAAERVYATGQYREGEFGTDYRLPLAKATKKHPFGAALQLGGGYYGRSYDAVLAGRNLRGPTAAAKLLLALGRRVEFDLGYDYLSLGATPSNQVLLLDEPAFGLDLNGNGNATDLNARSLTMVDRSRKEHSMGVSLRLAPSKPVDITLSVEHRWRRFTSNQSLDISDRGRQDRRDQASADLRLRLTKDLRARLGGVYSAQKLNRTGDPGAAGEIDDYTRSQGRLGLSYEL